MCVRNVHIPAFEMNIGVGNDDIFLYGANLDMQLIAQDRAFGIFLRLVSIYINIFLQTKLYIV